MQTKTAHRKQARAKRRVQADPASIYKVFARIQPFTSDEQTTITLPPRVAFEAIRLGSGSKDDFDTLAESANVAMVYSESIDPICVEACKRAQHALLLARERFHKTGKWGWCYIGLIEIPVMLDLYEQMVELSTPHQLIECMAETQRRMKARNVVVLEDFDSGATN